jgi:hypothetical protein
MASVIITGGIFQSSALPQFRTTETGGITDEKYWNVVTNGGAVQYQTINDAQDTLTTWLQANRNGNRIDLVTFNPGGLDSDLRAQGDTDTNLLFVDASTDRVGIGTATPAAKLDVVGNVGVSGMVDFASSTGEKLSLFGTGSYGIGVESSELRISSASGSKISFHPNDYAGAEVAKIEGAGLTVTGTANISGAVTHGNLAGTGTRPVMASSAGLLSAPDEKIWRFEITADGAANSGTADVFGANTAITTEASTLYEFEALIFYRRGVAGTTTFSLVNTQTYTRLNAAFVGSPAAGMGTNATSLGISGVEGITTATATLPTGATQTLNTDQFARLSGNFLTGTAGNWRIRWTTSAGSVTLQAGSFFWVRKITSASIGTFVA